MRRPSIRATGQRALLLCAAAACLIPAAGAKTLQLPSHTARNRSWAVSDMNGDRIADLASAGVSRIDGSGYAREISVNLAGAARTQFTVYSAGASIQLSLRDVDGDHDRDLVIVEPWSRRAIGIWLNDGQGHFEEGNLAKYSPMLGQPPPHSLESSIRNRFRLFARHEERAGVGVTGPRRSQPQVYSVLLPGALRSRISAVSPSSASPRGPPSLV